MNVDGADVLQGIRCAASRLGFVRLGIAHGSAFSRGEQAWKNWLTAGYHGTMEYMTRHERGRPETVMPAATSVICVALAYPSSNATDDTIAAYARGADYHLVFRKRLSALATHLTKILGRPVETRPCVDSAPLLEREAAMRAGIAFIGKSTMAIVPGIGSYILLGELLTDAYLPPTPEALPRCGSCTACLDACPTEAFVQPFVLDARRCISYLTIEHKGPIPRPLRAKIGTRIFGCDVCQRACPYNASQKVRPTESAFASHSDLANTSLVDFLRMGSNPYRRLVANSALSRVGRNQMARNAAIALGNSGDPSGIDALTDASARHSSAVVRSHAVWALSRFQDSRTATALENALHDDEPSVREEAQECLSTARER